MIFTDKKNISGTAQSVSVVGGNIEKPETVYVRELCFKEYREFPAVGKDGFLYVATDENAVYRFDVDSLTYVCVGRENKLNTIQCVIKKED